MADISTKIKDQTLTIREAVEGAGKSLTTSKGAPNSFAKNIEAAGLSLDDPWSSVKEESFLRKLNEVGVEGNFVTFNTVENELRRLSSVADISYPYSDVFSPEGKARGLKLEKAQQARRTKKFRGVPEAQKSLTALTEGIAIIKDPRTRAAVAFNALVPLRPGEVAGIKVDDIDFETGSFKESYRRVNKIRNELDLPEVALEIIRDAADRARAEGREYVFLDKDVEDPKKATSNFVNKMTTGMKMPGGVIERFKPFEKAMGRAVAGASDIRKIIPSIIASELGYTTEASAIMGHASFDETIDGMKGITRKHYVSQIITDEGTTAKQALRALQNMYGEVLGLSTLNEIPASMGVDANGLTSEGAPRLAVIPKGSEIVGTQVQGKLTDADLDLIDDVRAARSEQLKLEATTSRKQRLEMEVQMGDLDEEAERIKAQKRLERQRIYQEEKAKLTPADETVPTSDPEARASLERRGFDAKGMAAAINKHLGKLPGPVKKALGPVGVGLTAVTAATTAREVEAATGSATLGAIAGASEFGPVGFSDVRDLGAARATPDTFGLTPASRIAAEEDAGFIDLGRNREPETSPAPEEGFVTR
jgi:integrase